MAETELTENAIGALIFAAAALGMPLDRQELLRKYAAGPGLFGANEILRSARGAGLKARLVSVPRDRLPRTTMPALALLNDGRFWVIGLASDDKILIQDPAMPRPQQLSRDEFDALWSGRLIMLARRATLDGALRNFDIRWFLAAMHRYRKALGEVLVASFFIQLIGLASPLFFQVVVDKVLVHRGLSTLDVLMVGLAIISIFEVVLGALRTYLFSHTTNRIDVELGARVFDHLMALPIGYFANRRVGDSVARVRELETIRTFITGSSLTLTIDLFFTVVFLAVMFMYSAMLTWIVIASLPLYVAVSLIATPVFRTRLDEKFARGAENQSFLVESISGAETLKAMAVEPQMQRRWEEQLAAYIRASFNVQNLGNIASQIVQFVNKGTIVLTLFFGAKAVISGSLTVGELVAFNMLAARVAAPVLRIAQIWQDFQQTRISVDRLGDILNTPRELAQRSGTSLPAINGAIRFEHVTFRYRLDAQPVLSDVTLDFPAGQMIGVVGQSGSGKSTLAKLIQRLYMPEAGRVFVDGVDLAMVDTAWLRRQIGVVLQESVLFNRTVRENIALADPGATMERVITAAQMAGAHEFILELPQGYDTQIGERGSSLSGGQRQRVAIARALMTDPRILIFDEATSALDYESERIIQDNMRLMAQGRTVIIIAHRLSTIRRADRIITIERGRVVEDGTHDELIRQSGRYAQLHRLQAGITDVI